MPIDSIPAARTFISSANKYFQAHALPGEHFNPGLIYNVMRNGVFHDVERGVIGALTYSRSVIEETKPCPLALTEGIKTAQGLLDYGFPKIFGRPFPHRLIDIVVIGGFSCFAHTIAKKAVIDKYTAQRKPHLFPRIVGHECLHLESKSDYWLDLLFETGTLREGLNEFFTQLLVDHLRTVNNSVSFPPQDDIYIIFSRTVADYVFDYLLEGTYAPFVDFYNTGDIDHLCLTLANAASKRNPKDFKDPRVNELEVIGQAELRRDIVKLIEFGRLLGA